MTHPSLPARRVITALTLALFAAGCAAQTSTRYPSLLPRAIETRSDAEPEVAIAIAEPEPTTDTELGDLRKQLDAAVAAFNPAADTADRLTRAAKGDAVGGERWIAAQVALGSLDGLRATTSSLVSDVDALALARSADGKPEYRALTTLHADAQAALDAQAARIADIGARLPGA